MASTKARGKAASRGNGKTGSTDLKITQIESPENLRGIKTVDQFESFLIDHLKRSKDAREILKQKLDKKDEVQADNENIASTIELLNTISLARGDPKEPTPISKDNEKLIMSYIENFMIADALVKNALKEQ